jgi:hypothetical protein
MTDQQTISVQIDPLGRSRIEANGFAGAGCEAATEKLEKVLSGSGFNATKTIKDEWHETADTAQHQEVGW